MCVYSFILLQVGLCHLAAALDATASATDSWVSQFFLFGLMYVVIIWPLCIVLGLTVVCCICCKCNKSDAERDAEVAADQVAEQVAEQVRLRQDYQRGLWAERRKRQEENDEMIAVLRRIKKSVEDAQATEEAQAIEEVHAGEEEQAIEMGNVV